MLTRPVKLIGLLSKHEVKVIGSYIEVMTSNQAFRFMNDFPHLFLPKIVFFVFPEAKSDKKREEEEAYSLHIDALFRWFVQLQNRSNNRVSGFSNHPNHQQGVSHFRTRDTLFIVKCEGWKFPLKLTVQIEIFLHQPMISGCQFFLINQTNMR